MRETLARIESEFGPGMSDSNLHVLGNQAEAVGASAASLAASVTTQLTRVNNDLAGLDSVPATPEDEESRAQNHARLTALEKELDGQLERTKALRDSASRVAAQILDARITLLQQDLDTIRKQAQTSKSDKDLIALSDRTLALVARSNELTTRLRPQRLHVRDQLNLLGPAPASSPAGEDVAVAQQRAQLNAQLAQIEEQTARVRVIRDNAGALSTQILELRRSILKSNLGARSFSILYPDFWAILTRPDAADKAAMAGLKGDLSSTLGSAWQPGSRIQTLGLLASAIITCLAGRLLAEWAALRAAMRWLPEGRLRRSFAACASVAATTITFAIGIALVRRVFLVQPDLPSSMEGFVRSVASLAIGCVYLVALGRALLCTTRPSWRLSSFSDRLAMAMAPLAPMLAILMLIFGTIEQAISAYGTSLQLTMFANGLMSLVVALAIGGSAIYARRVRRKYVTGEQKPSSASWRSMSLAWFGVLLTVVATLVSLAAGYLTLARFLVYELVWVYVVLATVYFLTRFSSDLCHGILSSASPTGRAIQQMFSLRDRQLSLAATVLSAFSTTFLRLLALVALLVDEYGNGLNYLISRLLNALSADNLRRLDIEPRYIFHAAAVFVLGFAAVRIIRRWLRDDLLPHTDMNPGMRASLVAILGHVGNILVVFMILSALNVEWSKLAWIISALSVGIGFGLQEVVKNFVSGLILLTERPVKVGDRISIGQIEGDIRRINVRATEIVLGDRSTVIVPNSQLISQSVRNATMGDALSVVSLSLTFPGDVDPNTVREIILAACKDEEMILDDPPPAVLLAEVGSGRLALSVTGYIKNPRTANTAKSELLFAILNRLKAAEIPLSKPQAITLHPADRARR